MDMKIPIGAGAQGNVIDYLIPIPMIKSNLLLSSCLANVARPSVHQPGLMVCYGFSHQLSSRNLINDIERRWARLNKVHSRTYIYWPFMF